MVRVRTHVLLAAFMLMSLGATSAFAQSGFVKIDFGGAVLSSGGGDTTSVIAARTSVGEYDVTFNGLYGGGSATADQVIINTTAQSLNYGVTNAFVVSASGTTIVVHVYVWKSDTLAALDNNLFITINIGS